jgi:addiction module HigA family antidote
MRVPANRLTAILAGNRSITADTAIRLGKATGTTAEMWLGLQASHDLAVARQACIGSDVEPVAA